MTEEKETKEKEGSSGSSEIVEAVVDNAMELDEKVQKRRLTLLNLAMQDAKMMDICEKEGINPRDTFRGFVSDEEGRKRLRIVTVGEEGEEKAKEMINGLGNSDEWHVKNEGVLRVEWEDIEEMRKKREEERRLIELGMEKNRREDEERERRKSVKNA